MNPHELKDALEGMPLSKRATPAQMLLLLFMLGMVFVCGASAAWWAFDSRNAVVTAIAGVDSKVTVLNERQEAMLTKAEFYAWVSQLDKSNRTQLPLLVVPEPLIK